VNGVEGIYYLGAMRHCRNNNSGSNPFSKYRHLKHQVAIGQFHKSYSSFRSRSYNSELPKTYDFIPAQRVNGKWLDRRMQENLPLCTVSRFPLSASWAMAID